jgi:hypothetical protein
MYFCFRPKKKTSTNNIVTSDPIRDIKQDVSPGLVLASTSPVYPNSQANPKTTSYTPMKEALPGQSAMTDAYGRPLSMYPANSPTNTRIDHQPISGASLVASPLTSDITNVVTPAHQYVSGPQYGATELPAVGEHVVSIGGQRAGEVHEL